MNKRLTQKMQFLTKIFVLTMGIPSILFVLWKIFHSSVMGILGLMIFAEKGSFPPNIISNTMPIIICLFWSIIYLITDKK